MAMTRDRVHILFVNYSLGMGGIETLILEIAKRMDKNRFRASVCVFHQAEEVKLIQEFNEAGIPVYTFEKGRGVNWTLPFQIARLARSKGVDVIHSHNPSGWFYGGLTSLAARLPLVHTEHTSPDYDFKRWYAIERCLARITARITAVAGSVARFMREEEGIRKPVEVIYNGVEAALYDIQIDRAQKRKELGLDEKTPAIGIVARFFPEKDHKCLLEAFTKVVARIPRARLLIAGDGPLRDELVTCKDKLGLDGQVTFLGNRRDIPEFLKALDLFVLSSYKEGLPVVLLEAMAAGLATVATDVDGNPELVLDKKTGLVVPAKNPRALADAICELIADPARAGRMGEEGRRIVREKFNFRQMITAYESIYEVLARKVDKTSATYESRNTNHDSHNTQYRSEQ
ncbi:MAG: glycosyltransferase [Candidatus Omnitrophica bacterium]|nr:glycosyltransferase [Candidatus Omnitrophota bacterium]